MTTGIIRETATIYQFPTNKTRDGRDPRFGGAQSNRVIYESGAGSRYHEDAIREADEARKQ
jgi:hypothetical protein